MKKVKAILLTMVLSIGLVGNVFAGNLVGNGYLSFFDNVINSIVSLIVDEDCKPRQCQSCRPGGGGNGNCRPDGG